MAGCSQILSSTRHLPATLTLLCCQPCEVAAEWCRDWPVTPRNGSCRCQEKNRRAQARFRERQKVGARQMTRKLAHHIQHLQLAGYRSNVSSGAGKGSGDGPENGQPGRHGEAAAGRKGVASVARPFAAGAGAAASAAVGSATARRRAARQRRAAAARRRIAG